MRLVIIFTSVENVEALAWASELSRHPVSAVTNRREPPELARDILERGKMSEIILGSAVEYVEHRIDAAEFRAEAIVRVRVRHLSERRSNAHDCCCAG